MSCFSTSYLSLLRNRILLHLTKGRIVWIGGGPGTGKTYLAKHLITSKKFREFFIPLIDYDNFENYKDVFNRGGWGKKHKYYFIDSYDEIKIAIRSPVLVVSQTALKTQHEIVFVAPSGVTDIDSYLKSAIEMSDNKYAKKLLLRGENPRTILNITTVIRTPRLP